MTAFKVCGLSRADDAVLAAELGADFLGIVFVPGVRRQLSEERARAVVQDYRSRMGSGGPRLVGLFANQPVADVNRALRACGLDLAQLCGDEGPEFWEQVEAPIIRQIKVREEASRGETVAEVIRRVDEVVSREHLAILDRHERGFLGGTGLTFDWRIATEVAKHSDFLLAGGLTPDNVDFAISAVRPWGVDVSTGVETNGAKDQKKIAAFAERVRRAG